MSPAQAEELLSPERFDAVLFDLDGVVTATARVHAAAWKEMFDRYLRKRAEREGKPFQEFEIATDYRLYVDGKPRYEGVRSFLASRGIELTYGTPEDSPDLETVCGLGNRKNLLFNERIRRDGPEVFRTTVELIHRLKAKGIKVAVVSSSKNTQTVLQAAHLEHLFDASFDGNDAATLDLKGKPTPDTYLAAASRLGAPAERAVVVEDAISGVQAGKSGGFGLVIGVARAGNAAALEENGADVVVSDLGELLSGEGGQGMERNVRDLPSAMERRSEILERVANKRLAVFLDYDGTLTPIVSRPELAVISRRNQEIVRALADRCTVAIISGRDRLDVQNLVGLENLVYAGSHGFDIAGPGGQSMQHEMGSGFSELLSSVEKRLGEELGGIEGLLIEPKKSSVAVHYRLVHDEQDRQEIKRAVDSVLANHSDLRNKPGKMVWDIQPQIDWDKGKAVMWLLEALGLDSPDVLPMYLGDDITDEDAFRALKGKGIGIFVGHEAAEGGDRATAADYGLSDPDEVGEFLQGLPSA